VDPGDVRIEARGAGQTARTVRHLLPPEARAGRLIVVEVLTPGGNWSSYPPHKHDVDHPPQERLLEELYYYRFRRREGFAFQRVYTSDGDLDESLAPRDGDVVLVPRGYHPVAAAAGYDCYYLNVMAGPVREWKFSLDPDHAWLMNWSPDADRR
jgi:5-deoxy-glucuronate isomerase